MQVVPLSSRGWWVAVVYMWYAAMSWLHTAENMVYIADRCIIEGSRDLRRLVAKARRVEKRRKGKIRSGGDGSPTIIVIVD